MLQCMSPQLALSGGSGMSALTPLLEVKRTFVGRDENAAFDPTETLAAKFAVMHNAAFPTSVW
jgi:hypothetical protein